MKNRLKAFTIVELIVSMLLLVIIVSTVYLLIDMFNRQLADYTQINNESLELERFRNQLSNDFRVANFAEVDNDILYLVQNGRKDSYRFDSDKIIWQVVDQEVRPDTFQIPIAALDFEYEEEVVNKGLINRLNIHTQLFENAYTLSLQKKYTAAELLKYKP